MSDGKKSTLASAAALQQKLVERAKQDHATDAKPAVGAKESRPKQSKDSTTTPSSRWACWWSSSRTWRIHSGTRSSYSPMPRIGAGSEPGSQIDGLPMKRPPKNDLADL